MYILHFGSSQKFTGLIFIIAQNKEVSMVIILPNKYDGLAALTDKLEEVTTECSTRLSQTYEREVEVFLPKFRVESKLDLEKTLSEKVRRNLK